MDTENTGRHYHQFGTKINIQSKTCTTLCTLLYWRLVYVMVTLMYLTYSLDCLAHWSPILLFLIIFQTKKLDSIYHWSRQWHWCSSMFVCLQSVFRGVREWGFCLICLEPTDELGRKTFGNFNGINALCNSVVETLFSVYIGHSFGK